MVNNKNLANTYYYKDEDDIILYKIQSKEWFENGTIRKNFECFSKDSTGKWIYNFKNIKPVLYMLPSVIKAIENNETIIYAEDEKSADALQKLGFTATTTFGGIGSFNSFSNQYSRQVKNATVIVIHSNNEYSKRYAQTVHNAFKKQLSKMSYCKIFNKPTCFYVNNTYNGTKKTFRVAVLSVDKLKQGNIDIDFMIE